MCLSACVEGHCATLRSASKEVLVPVPELRRLSGSHPQICVIHHRARSTQLPVAHLHPVLTLYSMPPKRDVKGAVVPFNADAVGGVQGALEHGGFVDVPRPSRAGAAPDAQHWDLPATAPSPRLLVDTPKVAMRSTVTSTRVLISLAMYTIPTSAAICAHAPAHAKREKSACTCPLLVRGYRRRQRWRAGRQSRVERSTKHEVDVPTRRCDLVTAVGSRSASARQWQLETTASASGLLALVPALLYFPFSASSRLALVAARSRRRKQMRTRRKMHVAQCAGAELHHAQRREGKGAWLRAPWRCEEDVAEGRR
ncbi:hypothetical protein B0H14DRAFT_2615572 [Mycena olivaceomarginata]|nr:hypothetical protein B0H14DRAFT_2615572 [Mycena olivaceomarginata]